ncbi:acyltransferase [Kitasatospora sp. NPDC001309]|uniref:acyltransferase n=1 Tax=Kitasatospora sp. NPDC001309 TaxID=3364013 RepID=UPI0036CF50C7
MVLSTLETLRLTIAAIRQRTGESQRQLAAALDLTQDKVSRRQSGAQPWSLDEVDTLAGHWGMRPLDLLAGPTHATQALTWPPGTAAPAVAPLPVPATFAPVPAPVPAAAVPPVAAPAPGAPAAPVTAEAPPVEQQVDGPVAPAAAVPAAGTAPVTTTPSSTSAAAPAGSGISPTSVAVEQQVPADEAAGAEQLLVDAALVGASSADYDRGPDGEIAVHPAVPCEQCGRPVSYRIGGRPLHLGGWCTPTASPAADAPLQPAPAAVVDAPAPAAVGAGQDAPAPTAPAAVVPGPAASAAPSARFREYAGTGRELGYYLDMITTAVDQALEEHDGDIDAAVAALEKKAIPNGMALFDATRVGAAYEYTAYPERLEFLSKKSRNGADEIWEGRHKWENSELMKQLKSGALTEIAVDVLDTNAAYCSALKTHLPIGALQHRPDGGWDPKRSGVYLLAARPTWEHPHLPDPIGNRHEAGPVLLDEATVRLLIRCHKLGLSEAPHITEAWTSGASEGLLEKFRRVLTIAREDAITNVDQVTEKYVKAMYAKFASTIGESTYNRDIRRPEWMHIIRSQAFANLWYKSHRAHKGGLTIVALRGTDELHVTGGEWRKANGGVFEEGRLTTQLKLKDQYTLPRSRNRSA